MAREKDEGKRQAILAAAKRLFAEHGFHGAGIADLAGQVGLPVGSIYTYFDNKEALIRCVIEEGWDGFFTGLTKVLAEAPSAEARMALIVHRVLPGLFEDVDLISILLLEASRFVGIEAKLESLTGLVVGLVRDLAAERGVAMSFPDELARAALTLFFLGSLDTVRLSRVAGLGIPKESVIAFIRLSIENSFHVDLDPRLAGLPAGA